MLLYHNQSHRRQIVPGYRCPLPAAPPPRSDVFIMHLTSPLPPRSPCIYRGTGPIYQPCPIATSSRCYTQLLMPPHPSYLIPVLFLFHLFIASVQTCYYNV